MSAPEEGSHRNTAPGWPAFLGLVALAVAIGVVAIFVAMRYLDGRPSATIEAVASSVAALYSALAFAGVVFALVMQRHELHLQRQELAQSRDILSQQNATLKLQRFESSFFNLLAAHRDLVRSSTAVLDQRAAVRHEGLSAFAMAAGELTGRFLVELSPPPDEATRVAFANECFRQVCYQPHAEFGHYLRSLYYLVRFVTDADIEDKWRYLRLLRSQLSNGEQTVVFFYCLTTDGKGMKNFVERYHLLRGLREHSSVTKYRGQFAQAAFGATKRTRLEEPPELAV